MDRIDALRAAAAAAGADAVLLTALPDIRWATGFTGSNAVLLVLEDAAHFVTDGRYLAQAELEVRGAQVHVPGYQIVEHAASLLPEAPVRLGRQADELTLAASRNLEAQFSASVTWVDLEGFTTALRARKAEEEVAAIRRAQAITDAVFAEITELIHAGMTEREIGAEIVYRHLRRGASKMSFDPIVASGPNSALPHARPTDRLIQAGDMVVLDFGCVVDGYASDMTRTIAIGQVEPEARSVYEVVLAAQEAALRTARAGLTTAELDAAARDVISAAGYGEAFSHSLGHGIGLVTHEWPRLSQQTQDVLPAGCAVTIEPGIYLPGRFGVRIEDLIVLTETGSLNLTATPKTLLSR